MRTVELHHKLNFGEDILQRHLHDLSGGQQTRIGIARVLIADLPILLMDEPFEELDNKENGSALGEYKAFR